MVTAVFERRLARNPPSVQNHVWENPTGVVAWSFRKAAASALAPTGGASFGGPGKNSHGMLPSGIIYRFGIHDLYTVDKSANPALACSRGRTRVLN